MKGNVLFCVVFSDMPFYLNSFTFLCEKLFESLKRSGV